MVEIKPIDFTKGSNLRFEPIQKAEKPNEKGLMHLLSDEIPNFDFGKFYNSGQEAVKDIIAFSKVLTKKSFVIGFEECASSDAHFVYGTFNDTNSIWDLVANHPNNISAILIPPLLFKDGFTVATGEFLREVRKICFLNNIIFILDERSSGFMISLAGAQAHFDVDADFILLGNVLPNKSLLAVGGSHKVSTFFDNEVKSVDSAVLTAAAVHVGQLSRQREVYQQLIAKRKHLSAGLSKVFTKHAIAFSIKAISSLFSISMNQKDYSELATYLIKNDIEVPILPGHCWYINSKITTEDIDRIIDTSEQFYAVK